MERDCYQVEVLYFLNPHLIWIEVVDAKKDEFVFEQIGVYGILPFETTLDVDNQNLKEQRCDEWVAASNTLMKQVFSDARQVWFRPTHIDRRTSIFDDNIHKYGEIIIKKRNKKIVELSKVLIESGFAMSDVCLFHQELSFGNLKTKLSHMEIQEVIKNLENDKRSNHKQVKESSVKKQTTVFQAAQNLESMLTESNLRKHNKKFIPNSKIDMLLQMKTKDFDRCKDVEEESLGRANFKREAQNNKMNNANCIVDAPKPIPTLLRKKLELTKPQNVRTNEPLQVFLETKQYLEENARVKDTNSNDIPISNRNTIKVLLGKTIIAENVDKHKSNENNNKQVYEQHCVDAKEANKEQYVWNVKLEKPKSKYRNRNKNNKRPIPEYNPENEMRVAFGPPGLDPDKLPLKVVPKNAGEKTEKETVSKDDGRIEEPVVDKEMFADVDSNINIEITNRDILKETIKSLDHSLETNESKTSNDDSTSTEDSCTKIKRISRLDVMQKKLKLLKEKNGLKADSIVTSTTDTTNKDSSSTEESKLKKKKKNDYLDSDEENVSDVIKEINLKYSPKSVKRNIEKDTDIKIGVGDKNNVNPFKNIDSSISVFVDKLVTPVLTVHSKIDKRIEPCSNIRDVNFNTHIHVVLKNMGVERPMMMQMVSWPVILRGYSLFMIGPMGSGKTLGYLPAVCRLVTDFKTEFVDSVGPSCIIVCATAQSVAAVENLSRMFLGIDEKVVSCSAGFNELEITTALLNGCDLFICTPSVLVRLLQLVDFGVDLRRLSAFVLEDCERLSEVYANEVKFFLLKIREMLKTRANKELKVQFIVASRVWCEFLEPLAKKAPNSVVCIGAFQECVLYSKCNMSVDFVKSENKIGKVLEFLKLVDGPKKTVVVCRSDSEVEELTKVLNRNKCVLFACNSTMTVDELYNLSKSWNDYEEPILGPIMVCCDGNLNHLNVTDAHYLVHYSLPYLFSMFCKRFSVLNDNYPSIFKEHNGNVQIKIFLEESNVEQLPKILNFIKRCTDKVPDFLGDICKRILEEKDSVKANILVPLCDSTLAFGECPDFWNCQERHNVFKEYDDPRDWMPRNGTVTFKILHYHTPTLYSARLLSNFSNGNTKKYPQTYSSLSLKMGMYFSKETNRRLHGIPKVGDVCAVSVKLNFFVRCQVLKILTRYNNGTPNCVLIKLLDEEKLEKSRDIYLYHLPDDLKSIKTHVVQVRLANICPKDKDVTFSDSVRDSLKKITDKEEDLYMRGQVLLTVGNCIFVDTLEACQELTSLNEIVVRYNFKKELLETHAIVNSDHMKKLEKLCEGKITVTKENSLPVAHIKQQKEKLKPQWAHLESDDLNLVFFASAENPGTFYVRLTKFESCLKVLLKDIDRYIKGNPEPIENVAVGDIVLAKFPDDATYERARVDEVLNENIVKCFFVDQGDWRDVQIKHVFEMPSKFVTQMPFQAVECRLIGVKPVGDNWTDFGTNWFCDNCFESTGNVKQLYVKSFTKEKSANTGGHKYGVAIIDTYGEQDVVLNQLMIDLNLAQEDDDEIGYLQNLNLNASKPEIETNENEDSDGLDDIPETVLNKNQSLVRVKTIQDESPSVPLDKIFLKKPIRSVPLVESDNESADSWDVGNPQDFVAALKSFTSMNIGKEDVPVAKENYNERVKSPVQQNDGKEQLTVKNMQMKMLTKGDLPPIKNVLNCYQNEDKNEKLKVESTSLSSTLDSDDFSSPEGESGDEKSQISVQKSPKPNVVLEISKPIVKETGLIRDELRKPKILWRQNKTTVTVKIQLIGVDDYLLDVKDRNMNFEACTNDTKYGFDIELYGIVDDCVHSNKGQYILVKLDKVLKKNWLTLTKDGAIRKWIVYDVDSIDTSSDEDEEVPNTLADVIRDLHGKEESDSDDDFLDDINYEYKRDFD